MFSVLTLLIISGKCTFGYELAMIKIHEKKWMQQEMQRQQIHNYTRKNKPLKYMNQIKIVQNKIGN